MKVEIAFGQHFISSKMAADFLKSKNYLLKDNENIASAIIQVHHNKENSPLYITFHTYWQSGEIGIAGFKAGGRSEEFPFIDYYNWFEKNKSTYYTEDFFNNHMANLFSGNF